MSGSKQKSVCFNDLDRPKVNTYLLLSLLQIINPGFFSGLSPSMTY